MKKELKLITAVAALCFSVLSHACLAQGTWYGQINYTVPGVGAVQSSGVVSRWQGNQWGAVGSSAAVTWSGQTESANGDTPVSATLYYEAAAGATPPTTVTVAVHS